MAILKKQTKMAVRSIVRDVGRYPVVVQEDAGGGYWVNCPSFDGCYSQGETIEEALKNIREAIRLCMDEKKQSSGRQAIREVGLHFVTV